MLVGLTYHRAIMHVRANHSEVSKVTALNVGEVLARVARVCTSS